MRTYPFTDTKGRQVRIVEHDDGTYLESIRGYAEPFTIGVMTTGPEILKLATEGRALWDALLAVVESLGEQEVSGFAKEPVERALSILRATAPTFDHNEPEPVRVHSSGGQSGVDDWEMSDGTIKALSPAEARALKLGRFDSEHEHCPVCNPASVKDSGEWAGGLCRFHGAGGAREVSLKRDAPIPLVPEVPRGED